MDVISSHEVIFVQPNVVIHDDNPVVVGAICFLQIIVDDRNLLFVRSSCILPGQADKVCFGMDIWKKDHVFSEKKN
jgi:hypothetical protein